MRMKRFVIFLAAFALPVSSAYVLRAPDRRSHLVVKSGGIEEICRRKVVGTLLLGAGGLLLPKASQATERAIGAAEAECREAGNCLERGEIDGAIGWNWGAGDRCDPLDPRCGPNGVLLDEIPSGGAVPTPSSRITHEVNLEITIGRSESGILRLGLYGEATPKSVQELLYFLSPGGLTTDKDLLLEDGYSLTTAPVSIADGYGVMTGIVPSQSIVFGVPSQAASYARSRGSSRAGKGFVPQPRPKEKLTNESSARPHDVSGLVSIPGAGLGYANRGPEDEAFANAFQITAAPAPSMDRNDHKVVGQVMDDESMAFLARLATLPTKKGIKGVIPGLDSGPPLLKSYVRNVEIKKSATASSN